MNERWRDYVRTELRGSQQDLAKHSKIGAASISRWMSGANPAAEDAIRFARNLKKSPMQALLMAGYLTAEEANATISDLRIEDMEEIVLLDELKRRASERIAE